VVGSPPPRKHEENNMIANKTRLLLSTATMTPAEISKGRFMRSPDGHPDGGAAPAPAPAPSPAPAPEPEATAESLDAEFAPAPEGGSNTDDTGAPAPAPQPEPEPKPEGASVEERIGALTAAQREAERQAAEARREADELRRKYEPAPSQEQQPSAEGQAPDPSKYEFGEADPKFIADTARFHAKMEFQEQAAQAETRAQIADMEAKWQGEIAKPEVIEKYPDFDEKVTKGAESGSWDCSPLMALGIKQSPVGPDVAYHLATNTADASRIAKLSPIEQALEFGRLEGKFMHAPKADKQPVTTTSAPPPPPARARGAGGQFAVQADTDDFAAFDKMADGVLTKG
jgi:hypothetical protein